MPEVISAVLPWSIGAPCTSVARPSTKSAGRAVDAPEQSPRNRADQRVIQIALAPLLERPGLLEQEHRVDPVALGGQHRLDVFERLLQLLQFVLVIALHLGRDRLERLAVGVEPLQFGVGAGDDQLGAIIVERLASQADFLQAVRRHAHFFDLVARQPECLGRRVERLLDFLLRRAELDAHLEHRELPDGVGRGHLGKRIDGRVADLHRPRTDARHFLVGRECHRRDQPRQLFTARQHLHQPQQSSQAGGVLFVHHVGRAARIAGIGAQLADRLASRDEGQPPQECLPDIVAADRVHELAGAAVSHLVDGLAAVAVRACREQRRPGRSVRRFRDCARSSLTASLHASPGAR